MPSKKTINETKIKKTKKIKLRLKMSVGLQPFDLLNVLDMSSKSSCATLCHFKKSKISITKTSRWKFFYLKPTHFAASEAASWKIIVPKQRNLVRGSCTLEIHSPISVDTLNRKNVFFWKLQQQSR